MIEVPLAGHELVLATSFARGAELGGVSRVRGSIERGDRLAEDQLVGQLGEMALSKYLGGTPLFYQLTRMQRDKHPTLGDGGADLFATNVDVKCSLMRSLRDPWRYRLAVRPAERHADAVYVLALVPELPATRVWLLGWCAESDLPAEPERDGAFAGAYTVPARDLQRLPPLRFNWEWRFAEVQCR